MGWISEDACSHYRVSVINVLLNRFALLRSITIEIQSGKQGAVDFTTGPEPLVYKDKNGHLMVVRHPPPHTPYPLKSG